MIPPIRPPRIALPGDRPGEAWSELQRASAREEAIWACGGWRRVRRRFRAKAEAWVDAAAAGWARVRGDEA